MVNYTSQYQTQFEHFSNLYQLQLDPKNRWVQLGAMLPWDRMVSVYTKRFAASTGAPTINPRQIIGAFIIKHRFRLSDEQTLQTISENPYMQFFLGLSTFNPEPPFSPTLFVEMRKRLGDQVFDEFSRMLITFHDAEITSAEPDPDAKPTGKLKIDATVADQDIRYPTDFSLVNEARVKTEAIIDLLWPLTKDQLKVKPRTYRKQAHKRYLAEAKKKKSTQANRRKALRYQLNCVGRKIRMTAETKGPKPEMCKYQNMKKRDEYAGRNHIEGRISNAKQVLSLNEIKAKLRSTSETWIAATLFVLNLTDFANQDYLTF